MMNDRARPSGDDEPLDVTATDITRHTQLEQALRETKAQLEQVQRIARLGDWDLDIVSGAIRWSEATYRLLGLSPETFTPTFESAVALIPEHDRERVQQEVGRALRERRDYRMEHQMQRGDGALLSFESSAHVVCNVRGEPVRLVGTLLDITERKRAEVLLHTRLRLSELAQTGSLEELMRAAVDEVEALTDSRIGFFHFVEPDQENLSLQMWSTNTFQSMCQVQEMGRHYPISRAGVWVDCFHTRAPVIHNDYANLPHKKGLPPGHTPLVRDLAVPVLRDGRVVAIMGVGNKPVDYTRDDVDILQDLASLAMDLVARKQAEAAFIRRSEELERINAELEEFAYVASHDLKAPLRAVANLALVIDEDAADRLDEENRRRLRLLRDRIKGMDRLIDGMLRYARLGSSPIRRTEVHLDTLLRELTDELEIPPGFRVEQEGPLPTLCGDPLQLRQIFQNLLANVIDHHDRPEGTVRVSAHDAGDAWIVEVADDGPGIPAHERARLFRMFFTGKPGHTGIGLAMARKIVLTSGGQIEVRDNVPRGACFRITWPK